MISNRLILLNAFCLSTLFLLPACIPDGRSTPTPAEPQFTINEILQDYAAYQDQQVLVRGYGIIEAMMPLCPGYVGIDTRRVFVDEEGNNITAKLAGNLWEAMREDELREFLGYVRVFSGEIGCPGSIENQTFPYFEIVEVQAIE